MSRYLEPSCKIDISSRNPKTQQTLNPTPPNRQGSRVGVVYWVCFLGMSGLGFRYGVDNLGPLTQLAFGWSHCTVNS